MSQFKKLQVVRLARSVTVDGVTYPSSLRGVVQGLADSGSVRIRVADPAHPDFNGKRIIVGNSRIRATKRGRPKGSVKVVNAETAAAEA